MICLFLILISVWKRILMHQKHHSPFMERIDAVYMWTNAV